MAIIIKQFILVILLWLIDATSGKAQDWTALAGDFTNLPRATALGIESNNVSHARETADPADPYKSLAKSANGRL